MRRILPPLLLLLVLGWIVARTLARPSREAAQDRIRGWWEQTDLATRDRVVELTQAYASEFATEDDRRFAAHAFLRARRVDQAVRARWPRLEGSVDPEEAREFAFHALRVLGWDDEACSQPSMQNLQCMLALLEGGHEPTRRYLDRVVEREPKETMFQMMRRSLHLRAPAARAALAAACRRRAASEDARAGAAQGGDPAWSIAAAQLQLGRTPYPEREADVDLLVSVLDGPFRTQFPPRWMVACRVLGSSEHPRALEALRSALARLEAAGGPPDDVVVLRMALLASGDWAYEDTLRSLFGTNRTYNHAARALGPEALLDRLERRDPRVFPVLGELWQGEGLVSLPVREVLARGMLLGPEPPVPELPLDRLLADLEAPGTPATLQVVALAWRVRAGAAGSREALLRWLASGQGNGMGGAADVERGSAPLVTALAALYLYR